MNLKELNKSLGKSNKLILIGEEQYLVDYAIARLKKQLMPEFEIFNYIELDQERDNFQDCITKLESVPMMDLKKLVVIKKFVFAADNHPWNKTQLKIFKESVEKLSEDTTLVLTNDSVSKPANLKLIKEYSSLMNLLVLAPLDQANLMQFMKEYLGSSMPKEHIKMDALAYLVGASEYSNRGSKISLYDVKGMLDKVLAYYREFGTFTSKDAAMLFEQKLEGSVFKIVDAIAANNKSLAFSHYYALKEKGEASMKIMITIGKLFSTMVKASYYFDEGYNYQDVATELKKSEWNIKSGRSTYQKIGRLALIDMIDQILEVDYMMKTGQLVESMYGEMALMRIFQVRER